MRVVVESAGITFRKGNRSFPRVEIAATLVFLDMGVKGVDTEAVRAGLITAVSTAVKPMENKKEGKQ